MAKKCDLNSFELVPDLHFNVATLHRFLKNYEQAMVSLERAVELADEQVLSFFFLLSIIVLITSSIPLLNSF